MSKGFIDRSGECKRKVEAAIEQALEAMGLQAKSHAIRNIKNAPRVDTGRLSNSITHAVDKSEDAVHIGTNVEYAIYNEVGTGIYASTGNGRKTPWVYIDREGVGHTTNGMKPTHFLRNALQDHNGEYESIARQYLKV